MLHYERAGIIFLLDTSLYNSFALPSGVIITSVLENSDNNTCAIETRTRISIYLRTNGSAGLHLNPKYIHNITVTPE